MLTGKCQGLYILHHGKLTAMGGRVLNARHLENVVFDLGELPLRPSRVAALNLGSEGATLLGVWGASQKAFQKLRPCKR